MSETKKPKELTREQVETILNSNHIWQHLIKAGFINNRGEVVSNSRQKHRLPRRHTSNYQRHITYTSQLTVRSIHKSPVRKNTNLNESTRLQESDLNPRKQRLKSVSTLPSKQTNKAATVAASKPLSSSTESTFIKNVLIRRAVSPKILLHDERCMVTMRYLGEFINIDFNRSLYLPPDDQIRIMQQHCGGENRVVYQGYLKPNEDFSFESLRHTDYPFALAFYINGVIVDRLSVCCEYRFKNAAHIGGRTGAFVIQCVERARACRKCRFEEHMAKVLEEKPELKPRKKNHDQSQRNTSNSKKSSSPSTVDSKSNSFDNQNVTSEPLDISSSKTAESDNTNCKTSLSQPSQLKPLQSDDDGSKDSGLAPSGSKLFLSDDQDWRTSASVPFDSKPLQSGEGSKDSESAPSSPKSIQCDDEGSKTSEAFSSSSAKINARKIAQTKPMESPKSVSSDEEDSMANQHLAPNSTVNQSNTNIPTIINRSPLSTAEIVKSDQEDDSVTNELNKRNRFKATAPRVSSPESIKSDMPSLQDRDSPTRLRPMTAPVNQRHLANQSNPVIDSADYDEPFEDINSSISTVSDENQSKPSLLKIHKNHNKTTKSSRKNRAPEVSSENSDD